MREDEKKRGRRNKGKVRIEVEAKRRVERGRKGKKKTEESCHGKSIEVQRKRRRIREPVVAFDPLNCFV